VNGKKNVHRGEMPKAQEAKASTDASNSFIPSPGVIKRLARAVRDTVSYSVDEVKEVLAVAKDTDSSTSGATQRAPKRRLRTG
jgi:hypothetical protein